MGSLRNYQQAQNRSRGFDAAHLITVREKPFLMEETFDLDFLIIHEVKHLDYRVVSGKLTKEGDLNDRINARRTGRSTGMLTRLLDSYPGNLVWGEGGIRYIRNALRTARRLVREQGITHVYSSFRPMADHFVAYRLKREFPQLVWIADFRDLPVDRHRRNVFRPDWQDRVYRKWFSRADELTTVSEGLKRRLLDYRDRVSVIRNAPRELFTPADPRLPDVFTLSYTGSLYPRWQDPTLLFAALRELIRSGQIPEKEIRLVYAGKDHRIWNGLVQAYGLEEISVVRGRVSLSESIRLQHESHVNVLFSWSGPHSGGVLTGKLAEYLGAGRPVLCLVNGVRDAEWEELGREHPSLKIFWTGNGAGVREAIRTWHRGGSPV